MGEEEAYDRIAREAIEHALGRTFENPEAVPRRDAFIRDATDLLARFVAARCGNPGFHSARFFDAVIALSNARARIRDAARRSRVVERLVEAERRVRTLENVVKDRNDQLVQATKGEVGTLARALSEADQRIRTLEAEVGKLRDEAARGAPSRDDLALDFAREGPRAGSPDGPATIALSRLDADEGFHSTAAELEKRADETTRTAAMPIPDLPPEAAAADQASRATRSLRGHLVLEPERRLAEARTEIQGLNEALARLRSDKDHLELEREAQKAQLDQLAEREKAVRDARAAIGAERDALILKVQEGERALEKLRQERDEGARARLAVGELKKSVEQELALAQKERDDARAATLAKDAERARAEAAAAREQAQRVEAEGRASREATAASRARRERDEGRTERDRLRSRLAELEPANARHEALLEELGCAGSSDLAAILTAVARRHEVVVCHEPPEWDETTRRLALLRDRGGRAAAEAAPRLERLARARARYEALVARAQAGDETGAGLLELATILAAHEQDRLVLDLLDAPATT